MPHGEETVLLIEDEEAVRRLAREVLELCGYQVLAVVSGEEAIALAASHSGPIHLLLTDIFLPHLSGPEVARRLLLKHPHLRILFISGYTSEVIVLHGLVQPETSFLQKPITPRSLSSKVREVLSFRPKP